MKPRVVFFGIKVLLCVTVFALSLYYLSTLKDIKTAPVATILRTRGENPNVQTGKKINSEDDVNGTTHQQTETSVHNDETHNNRKENGGQEFEDVYLAPLLQWYREAATWATPPSTARRYRTGEVPKVVVYVNGNMVADRWYEFHMRDINEGRCPLPCHITHDITQVSTADAVLIHIRSRTSGEEVVRKLGPRDPSQPWVMFEVETELLANSIRHINYSTLNSFFNRTMYFRGDSDILLQHGFIVRRGRDASLLPPTWRRPPVISQTNFSARKLVVAFISNCHDNSGRIKYVKNLQKHMKVDVYGKCGQLKCGSSRYIIHNYRSDTNPCLVMAGRSYLFFLAFENALCEDYVTEKLYNLLFYPIVPVVMGAVDYSSVMPPHSYIDASLYTPQQLALKLTNLASHPQEYAKYLTWRRYYQPSTVGGNRILCLLCVRLHQPDFYQHHVIRDFREWFVKKSNCNRNRTVAKHQQH